MKKPNGFTMIEVVVMLAIVAAISGAVLFSFGGLNEGGALNRSARELALSIRQAQNTSLTVKKINVGNPPTTQIPQAVGLQLTRQQNIYFLYADLDNPTNYKYNSPPDGKIDNQDQSFLRNIQIDSLTDSGGSSYQTVNVVFVAPEASLYLTDSSGNSIGNVLNIVLKAPTTGQTRTLIIRTSGQITVR